VADNFTERQEDVTADALGARLLGKEAEIRQLMFTWR
jgi:hypothetical protein